MKRDSSSVEGVDGDELVDSKKKIERSFENAYSKPSKKIVKKDKKKHVELSESEHMEDDTNAASTSASAGKSLLNSMERRKQRKLLDKERHKSEEKRIVTNAPVDMDVESKGDGYAGASSNGANSVLPEFHIGVFKDLAAAEGSIREAAARSMVMELREIQNAYEKLKNKDAVEDASKLEAEKDDGLDNCAPSLRYAVRRLIRGVSSSREYARQGFSLGLTALLGAVPSIKLESLLKLIVNLLEISSSMKGQEARDCLLGRLFAYGAIAKSGKLTEECMLNNKMQLIEEFTSSVIGIAAKKRYLQESSVAVLLEIIEKLTVDALKNYVLKAPGFQEWFEGATDVGNPDALLLALKLQEKVGGDYKYGNLLPSPYSKSTFFAASHLSNIAGCLKESTFCQPRVHSVWPVLVRYLLPDGILQDADSVSSSASVKKHKKGRKCGAAEDLEKNLSCFFEVIIEGSLLPSSHDRKKLALDVILLLLPKLPTSCVHVVFSYKVVQCLMDILSTKDSWLYKVAQHFIKEISKWVAPDDFRRVEVIVALQKHSHGKFDCITRTKTVKDLMAEFKTEPGCLLFIQNLMTMFLDEGHSSEESSDQSQTTDDNSEVGSIEDKYTAGTLVNSEFLKSWIIESLPNIPKHLKLDQDATFRVQKEVLKFLAVQGLFSSSLGSEVTSFELQEKFRWPKSTTPSALTQVCIEQLQILLANAQKGEGSHTVTSGVEAKDLGSYFMHFYGVLSNIPSVTLSRTLSIDDEEVFKKLQTMESQLSREERKSDLGVDASKLHALRYLLSQLFLQILLRPREFFEAASELVMCCERVLSSSDLPTLSGGDDPDEEDEPELMDVLLDTMLSLLPQSSAPLRSAIEQVFKHFCHDITDDGLLRMLRVIKKDLKPARHKNAVDEDTDADEDDLLGVEEADESEGAEETGETADTDEQTDDSEAVVGVPPTLTTELPEAASDDDSDEGMDDDAMFRMDVYLQRIFREKKKQAGGETAHSQLVLFKLRVLSLLEIYLHENPDKPQVVKVFSNLAQAYINPQTKDVSEQLGQRIWGIIQKKIFKAKDHPRGEAVEFSVLEPLLEKYLKLAAKPFKKKKSASNPSKKKQSSSWNRYKMINSLAQSSTFWLLKIINARDPTVPELERVCEIFQNVFADYFDSKKSQIKCEFLKELCKRRTWIGHRLFGFLLEKCAGAKLQYRRVESLELVMEVIKIITNNDDMYAFNASEITLENNLSRTRDLVTRLVTDMPEKQSRRAEVRKFCGKLFHILSKHNLGSRFLSTLPPDAYDACESQLGEGISSFL